MLTDDQRREAAAALRNAERSRVPIPPLTETWPGIDVYDAYAIQLIQVKAKLDEGATVQGMKVGLTSQAMQEMLGVDEPDFGHLLAGMFVLDGGSVPGAQFCAPRIEPEIAFVLGEQLQGPGITAADVLAATEAIVPALEIIDSRIEGWRIKLADTVADAASSARVVLGETRAAPADLDLAALGVVMSKNGDIVEKATGAAVMGHPANAVAWLANKLSELKTGLEAGYVIMPGACTRAIPVEPGDSIEADFDGLGQVSVSFT